MVYGMAQRHGADVEIESELGLGTTMRLIFPAAAPAQNKHGAGATRAAPPLRLLVIDDDPLLLRSLRDMLESDGHTVVTADGGQKGIDLLFPRERAASPSRRSSATSACPIWMVMPSPRRSKPPPPACPSFCSPAGAKPSAKPIRPSTSTAC